MRRFAPLLRSSHFLNAARHPARSRAGGVAVANAAKNAREAFFAALFLCLPLITTKHTREAVAGYGTSGSFASICRRACDSNAARPALGGMASDEKQMRRAKQRREAPHLRYLRFLFHRAHSGDSHTILILRDQTLPASPASPFSSRPRSLRYSSVTCSVRYCISCGRRTFW